MRWTFRRTVTFVYSMVILFILFRVCVGTYTNVLHYVFVTYEDRKYIMNLPNTHVDIESFHLLWMLLGKKKNYNTPLVYRSSNILH